MIYPDDCKVKLTQPPNLVETVRGWATSSGNTGVHLLALHTNSGDLGPVSEADKMTRETFFLKSLDIENETVNNLLMQHEFIMEQMR